MRTPVPTALELELAPLPDETRAAMVTDIEQMDAIVRQFLDYARKAPQAPATEVNLSAAVAAAVQRARIDADADSTLDVNLAPDVRIRGYPVELDRALDNLLTNAVRYGHDPETSNSKWRFH